MGIGQLVKTVLNLNLNFFKHLHFKYRFIMKTDNCLLEQAVLSPSVEKLFYKELVIADAHVADLEHLVNTVSLVTDICTVTPLTNFQYILEAALNAGYTKLHFLGHGEPGYILMGGRKIGIKDFIQAFSSGDKGNANYPSLHFWSCNTGFGKIGNDFVNKLKTLSGTVITAFSGTVGNSQLGGTWIPDIINGCNSDATEDLTKSPFINALSYPFALSGDVLSLVKTETTNGFKIEIYATGLTSKVNTIAIIFNYGASLATPVIIDVDGDGSNMQVAVPSSTISGLLNTSNEFSTGVIKIGGTGLSSVTIPNNTILYALEFTYDTAAKDFSGSLEPGTFLKLNSTTIPLGTLPIIDTVEAEVFQIAITSAIGAVSGLLNGDDVVTVTVTTNKNVTVDTTKGTPTLKLDIGGVEKTATYLSGSGSTSLLFTYTVQSGDTDANGISIGANALALNGGTIKDGLSNDAIITSSLVADNNSYKVDTTAPTATIALADSALLVGDTSTTVTITFNEAVTGFDKNDLTVQGGALSTVTSTDGGITWTGTFTPTANLEDATNVITLANTYTDVAGKTGTTATSANYVIDLKAPTTPTIVFADTALKIGETSLVTITFNEAVASFANADLTVVGGTLSTVTSADGGVTWTGTFTPTANLEDATYVITLANTYTDVAGNAGVGATSANYTIDTTRPTVTVTASNTSLAQNDFVTITMTMSEAVIGFAADDIKTSLKYSLANFQTTSANVYTATYTATEATTDLTKELKFETNWQDAAGNQPVFGPTVAISFSDSALKIGETSTATFTFSAAPKDSNGADITASTITTLVTSVENGALSGFTKVSDTVYTATLTPTSNVANATNKITVGTNWKDAAGLVPTGTTDSPNYAIDTAAPTVAITSDKSAVKVGETATITLTFSEDPGTTFADVDITTTGGTLGTISGTGLTRAATFTPTANTQSGTAGITVASGNYTDAAGNNGGAGTTPSITIDTAAPTVAITSNVSTLKSGETATISFMFSEDPGSSFISGDITTTGGTLGSLNGTGLVRTAIFTPAANFASGNASITVANASYTDRAGNTGFAGTTPVISIDTLAPAAPTSVAESPASTDLLNSLMNNSESATTTFRVVLPTTGSIAVANDNIELLMGDASFTAQKKVTLSSQNITDGYVDFTVAKADLGADGSKALTSKITDAAGNVGAASLALNFTLDTTAPSNTISGIGVASGNTSVNATLSAGLLTGETLWAAIGSNALVDITNTSVSTKTIAWSTTVPAGDTTLKFEVRDLAGNATISSATISGTTTTTTTTITDTVGTTLTAPDGNPIPAAVLVTGSSNEQILLAAMPSGLSLIVKEISNSADTTLDTKLNDSLNALPPAEINVSAVQAGIDSYLETLSSGVQANVLVRTIEFPASTELLSAPTANQLVINGSTAGNEALVIDTRNLPDGSVIDLQDVEFAIIIGDNVTIRGGAGSNVVYAGSGRQDIKLGVLDDTIHGGAGDDTIASTSGDDWLYGDDGNDSVSGGDDNDHLFGGADNDTLNGEAGNDLLDGGEGTDTAVFSGNFGDYTITRLDETHFKIIDTKTSDGDDGTDIVTNVEYFKFANVTYDQGQLITADPYAGLHDSDGRPSTEVVLAGVGGLGLLAWLLF